MQAKRSLEPANERFVKRMFPLERILNKGVFFLISKKIDILCVAYENGIPTKRMFPLERILNKAEAAGDFNNYA